MHNSINHSLLQDFPDDPLQGEADYQPLEHLPPFSNHPSPFQDDGDNSTPANFRPSANAPAHPVPLHPSGSFSCRTPALGDLSFPPGSSISMSASTSSGGSCSTSPSSGCSTYASIPQHGQFTVNSSSQYNIAAQSTASFFSPSGNCNQNFLHNPAESRPRLHSIPLNAGIMPPPIRGPIPVSPPLRSNFANDYSPAPSHLSRHTYPSHTNPFHLSPSPQSPLSAMSRSLDSASGRGSPASTAHYSFTNSMQIEMSPHLSASGQNVPPFDPTESFCQLVDSSGRSIQTKIHAKIDKGFFRADQDWTCYRRNYFSVACSYGLESTRGDVDHERVSLHRSGQPDRILGFFICIAAKVDGEDGKAIELVQHTPKRDKGPMTQPEKRELKPNPSGNLGLYSAQGFGAGSNLSGDYDSSYLGAPQENQSVTTFERIQFKKATANNGKRRAAQQYFHIVVELFAKVYKVKGSESEYVKIAHRVSAQMVVRGRSPGHYQDERRGSSSTMGPGSGSGGDFGASPRDGTAPGASHHSHLSGQQYTSRPSYGNYQGHHHSSVSYGHGLPTSLSQTMPSSITASLDQMTDPAHSSDMSGAKRNFKNTEHFQYYANGSYETQGPAPRSSAGPLALSSNTSSPTHYEMPNNYHSIPAIKDEPYEKVSVKTGEHAQLGTTYGPLQLPIFGKWLNGHEALQPPRDCRGTMHIDAQRMYYAQAPAAW